MASQFQTASRTPMGGVDRSVQGHVANLETWWDLLNWRPSNGRLEQTPPFIDKVTLSSLSSESATEVRYMRLMPNVAGNLRYFVLTENRARFIDPTSLATQVLIPQIVQAKVPNNTTVNGQALMGGFNTTDFAADGDDFEVEIIDGTNARWRKNGGSWTNFAIALENSIGANGLKVYFQATTGFTTGDLWQWERQASTYSGGLYPRNNVQGALFNKDLYLAGYDREVRRVRDNFMTSVGYKRVYGKYVAVFYNHLVIGQFAEGEYDAINGVDDPYDALTTPWNVSWSDLNDPDEFFATAINEADTYQLSDDDAVDNGQPGITGMEKLGNTLFIYSAGNIWSMNYVGLPNVMQIDSLDTGVGCFYHGSLVKTPRGHFFWGRDNIYLFNGSSVQTVGYRVKDKIFAEVDSVDTGLGQRTWGFFDKDRMEVIWTYWIVVGATLYQARQVIYQLDYDRWYFRNDFCINDASSGTRAMCPVYQSRGRLFRGTASGKLLIDYNSSETIGNSVTDDANDGVTPIYTKPIAETADYTYADLQGVKEQDKFFIDADYTSSDGIQLSVASRSFASAAVSFTAVSTVWTPSVSFGVLTYPMKTGKIFRYKMTLTGTKPYGGVLSGFGDYLYTVPVQE